MLATLPSALGANPFADVEFFVNPVYAAQVASSVASVGGPTTPLGATLNAAAHIPTAVWIDSIGNLQLARDALTQAWRRQRATRRPVLTVFVVYNLPDRDCAASASVGELSGGEAGLERYTREFIEPLAEIVRGFPEQRVAFMLEPDSLPNLVSSTWSARCQRARKTYVRGIARAIGSLAPLGAVYVDVGNAQWCQWFVEDLAKMLVEILRLAGPAAAQVRAPPPPRQPGPG